MIKLSQSEIYAVSNFASLRKQAKAWAWGIKTLRKRKKREFHKISFEKKIKHFNFMESLILAQSERWRRA